MDDLFNTDLSDNSDSHSASAADSEHSSEGADERSDRASQTEVAIMTSEQAEQVAALITDILAKMSVDSRVSVEQNIKGNVFNISSPDSSLLIGQRGMNLHALQVLAQGISYHKLNIQARFSVDVDDYKKKREWYLRENAKKALSQVRQSGRPMALEPMSAHERRIIHAFLSEEYGIETESIGVEPNRKIVIKPKAKGEI